MPYILKSPNWAQKAVGCALTRALARGVGLFRLEGDDAAREDGSSIRSHLQTRLRDRQRRPRSPPTSSSYDHHSAEKQKMGVPSSSVAKPT